VKDLKKKMTELEVSGDAASEGTVAQLKGLKDEVCFVAPSLPL
jgi:hypothetical protein